MNGTILLLKHIPLDMNGVSCCFYVVDLSVAGSARKDTKRMQLYVAEQCA